MRRRPLREESRRCSPSVVCADSFETRPHIPLIMSVGLHGGRTEKHMGRCRPIAFSLIHTVQTVIHRLWIERVPARSCIVLMCHAVQFNPVSGYLIITAGVTMAGEFVLSLRAHEVADAKDQNEMANTLKAFGKGVVALRDLMDQNRSFTDMELLFIENHFQVIQMAYLRWKRKHRLLPIDSA